MDCFNDTELGKHFFCPCEKCHARLMARGRRWDRYRQLLATNIKDFWTGYSPHSRAQASGMYGGFEPTPLTDEEKQEMADCGC